MNGKTILVIEDNPMNKQIVVDLLELAGARVYASGDAETGLEILSQAQVDLVLMDISLPAMDGLEATRRIKADPATTHIPVVALTAHTMSGDRVRDAGCDGYMTKPIQPRTFCESLRGFLAPAPARETARMG